MALRKAIKLSHTLWGGAFNPIIVIDNVKQASELVRLFSVDALYSPHSDDKTKEFLSSHPNIPWPVDWEEFFIDQERLPTVLDVSHPILQLSESHQFGVAHDGHGRPTFFEWTEADPLGDLFLALFGSYPAKSEYGIDYRECFVKTLGADVVSLTEAKEVPAEAELLETPNLVCTVSLETDYRTLSGFKSFTPGIFVGSVSDFDDLVMFWNLRSAGIELTFYDEKYDSRLFKLNSAYAERLAKRYSQKPTLTPATIWSPGAAFQLKERLGSSKVPWKYLDSRSDAIWNGLNVRPYLKTFGEKAVLASTDSERGRELTFQLPEFPFIPENAHHTQHLVMTTNFASDLDRNTELMVRFPAIPELNEFVGRATATGRYWKRCRLQNHGIDYVIHARASVFYIKPVRTIQFIEKFFSIKGIKTAPSKPGLIASRLIDQMGGIQGCRVLKISGVRTLIRKHGPHKSFTKGAAVKLIGNIDDKGVPNFSKYKDLSLGQGWKDLSPGFAFDTLLEKQVFRVGLEFSCPQCALDFWRHLDCSATIRFSSWRQLG